MTEITTYPADNPKPGPAPYSVTIRKNWEGPGSLDQILHQLAFPPRFKSALDEIEKRSGIRITRRTLDRYVTEVRKAAARP